LLWRGTAPVRQTVPAGPDVAVFFFGMSELQPVSPEVLQIKKEALYEQQQALRDRQLAVELQLAAATREEENRRVSAQLQAEKDLLAAREKALRSSQGELEQRTRELEDQLTVLRGREAEMRRELDRAKDQLDLAALRHDQERDQEAVKREEARQAEHERFLVAHARRQAELEAKEAQLALQAAQKEEDLKREEAHIARQRMELADKAGAQSSALLAAIRLRDRQLSLIPEFWEGVLRLAGQEVEARHALLIACLTETARIQGDKRRHSAAEERTHLEEVRAAEREVEELRLEAAEVRAALRRLRDEEMELRPQLHLWAEDEKDLKSRLRLLREEEVDAQLRVQSLKGEELDTKTRLQKLREEEVDLRAHLYQLREEEEHMARAFKERVQQWKEEEARIAADMAVADRRLQLREAPKLPIAEAAPSAGSETVQFMIVRHQRALQQPSPWKAKAKALGWLEPTLLLGIMGEWDRAFIKRQLLVNVDADQSDPFYVAYQLITDRQHGLAYETEHEFQTQARGSVLSAAVPGHSCWYDALCEALRRSLPHHKAFHERAYHEKLKECEDPNSRVIHELERATLKVLEKLLEPHVTDDHKRVCRVIVSSPRFGPVRANLRSTQFGDFESLWVALAVFYSARPAAALSERQLEDPEFYSFSGTPTGTLLRSQSELINAVLRLLITRVELAGKGIDVAPYFDAASPPLLPAPH